MRITRTINDKSEVVTGARHTVKISGHTSTQTTTEKSQEIENPSVFNIWLQDVDVPCQRLDREQFFSMAVGVELE